MKIYTRVVTSIFYLLILYLIFTFNNILFHSIVGLIEVSLGMTICLISIITLKINRNTLLNILAPGIFASTILIMLHSIIVPNVLNITDIQAENIMRNYWIIAMYMIAITFIQALVLEKKDINFFLEMTLYLLFDAIIILLVSFNVFPNIVDSVTGEFSLIYIVFEIILIGLFIFIMYYIFLKRNNFIKYQLYDIEASIFLFIIAEIFYAFRIDLFDNEFIVHSFRSIAIIYLSLSLFQRNIRIPLDSIFTEINVKLNEINKQAELSEKNVKLFKNLYEKAPVSYLILDKNDNFIYVNDMFEKISGYNKEELMKIKFPQLLNDKDLKEYSSNLKILSDSGYLKVVYNIKTKLNREIPMRLICQLSEGIKTKQLEKHCIIFDISNEVDYQKHLLENEEKLSEILNSTDEGIYTVNSLGECTYINENAVKLLKFKSDEEILFNNIHNLIHKSHNSEEDADNCPLMITLKTGTSNKAESTFYCSDGSSIPVELYSYPKIEGTQVIGAVVSFKDITERNKFRESLFAMSYRDSLTGLYNHRYYEINIKEYDKAPNYPLAILVGDINGLKMINDAFGHKSGDELLINCSKAILSCVSERALVSRVGGDEFVILVPNTDKDEALKIINEISNKINQVLINSISASISLGLSIKFSSDISYEKLYSVAEDAMYRNKIRDSETIKTELLNRINEHLNKKDPYAKEHASNVVEISEKIGKIISLKSKELKILKKAALFHDIGKIVIPEVILNKNDKLTDEEYIIMKQHADIGFRILNSVNNMKDVAEVILNHHERWDGFGYPRGIKGEEIPLLSRIIAIAEAFDVMTSERDYKQKLSYSDAIQELKSCSDTQFDSSIVNIFISNFKTIISD